MLFGAVALGVAALFALWAWGRLGPAVDVAHVVGSTDEPGHREREPDAMRAAPAPASADASLTERVAPAHDSPASDAPLNAASDARALARVRALIQREMEVRTRAVAIAAENHDFDPEASAGLALLLVEENRVVRALLRSERDPSRLQQRVDDLREETDNRAYALLQGNARLAFAHARSGVGDDVAQAEREMAEE